ncbi:ATPase associated with various cellular activities AAA_3 [Emticicia oligotrophica DSM 17448]|uniref:ATPase associated with various cellular activities AAA_3 n=1 Tax=Emticicia oligotrophica (strain DSM 17448 / CIP 109782 / MTCC 6937 / GPTSA100-15) TaxID=929562 RepID=A0ABN4AR21_EMTOG|nr:ATPase associated with various cellular activities AAA_3 [Emticicia oligotrophica DSM 17448]
MHQKQRKLETKDLHHYKSLVGKLPLLKKEIAKVIVGQEAAIDEILISLLAGGHCLLEGVPGLAKTLMVKTISEALDMKFKRIQFTPDLMPGDILGTEILEEDHETGKKFFKFNRGPIFANIVLADEINRTPPKTQAALLEAMQEYKVTYAGTNYDLPKPFLIIATQNPIEQAGTYPLPEAQLDRFLLYIKLGYPSESEELNVLKNTTGTSKPTLNSIMSDAEIIDLQHLTRQVHISEELIVKINKIVRSTRPANTTSAFVKEWSEWGAGPRAGQALVVCAKARAVLNERFSVIPEDIEALTYPILRHRIALNFRAEAAGISTDDVITDLLK